MKEDKFWEKANKQLKRDAREKRLEETMDEIRLNQKEVKNGDS